MLADFQRRHPVQSFPLLIIEDNDDHQLLIGYSIRSSIPQGQPVFASSAEEALIYLESTCGAGLVFPSLVLLDIYLPDPEEGLYALREIRASYPLLPILVLSNCQDYDLIEKVYELGANSFMNKPITLEGWESNFQSIDTYWLCTVRLPYTHVF